jgi:hypothetical protein
VHTLLREADTVLAKQGVHHKAAFFLQLLSPFGFPKSFRGTVVSPQLRAADFVLSRRRPSAQAIRPTTCFWCKSRVSAFIVREQ